MRCVISASSGHAALQLAPSLKASFSEVLLARQLSDALRHLREDESALWIICVSRYIADLEMIEMMRKMQVENLALALIEDGLAGYKSFSDFMNAGADDAQPMSIDPAELEARVEALIRRMEKPETPWMLPVGPAMLNSSTGWITSDYGSVHLTECETKTLELLVHKNGSIVTKEMVMNYLYGGRDEPEFKVVDVYICKLRKKLFSICGGKDVIETLWGRGYRYAILGVEPTFTKGRARVAG